MRGRRAFATLLSLFSIVLFVHTLSVASILAIGVDLSKAGRPHQDSLQPSVPLYGGESNSGVVYRYVRGIVATTPVFTLESVSVESPHPYSNNYNNVWEITRPEAGRMRIHFVYIRTESGYDYVRVKNATGTIFSTYSGSYSDVWSSWVTGNTIVIQLTSDSSDYRDGFIADRLEWTPRPSLQVTVSADPSTVWSDSSSTIRATVTTSDGSSPTISYSWTATGGSLSSTTGNPVTWRAPTVSSQTTYRISVTASASGYTSGSGYVDATVKPKDVVATSLTVTLSPSEITENTRTAITISGRLTRADTGSGIANQPIYFDLLGSVTTRTTDANGYYSLSTEVTYSRGTHQISAQFTGAETSNIVFKSSNASATVTAQINILPYVVTLIAAISICVVIGVGLYRRRGKRHEITAAPSKPPVPPVVTPPSLPPPKPITPPPPAKTTCPGCGAALPPGARFCGKCGAKLS